VPQVVIFAVVEYQVKLQRTKLSYQSDSRQVGYLVVFHGKNNMMKSSYLVPPHNNKTPHLPSGILSAKARECRDHTDFSKAK
jgi:hypothetical protein